VAYLLHNGGNGIGVNNEMASMAGGRLSVESVAGAISGRMVAYLKGNDIGRKGAEPKIIYQ